MNSNKTGLHISIVVLNSFLHVFQSV